MSNVSAREKTIRLVEVVVPNPATRRDVCDLLRVADQKYREVTDSKGTDLFDDAYTVEARDDEIVATVVLKEEYGRP